MLSFKTELKLNNKQRSLMAQHAGCARFAYNWGLALTKEILNHNQANPDNKLKFPTGIDLHKRFVAEVKSANSWLYQSSKCAPQQALRDLRVAWDRAFKKIAKPPKFKKKGVKDGFYLEGSIKVEPLHIKLPRIGWVKTYEILPSTQVKNVRITRKADRWFIAFKVDATPSILPKMGKIIGVDLGIKSLAVCSNGTVFENPRAYKKLKRKLAHLQRAVSRKVKGSNNRKKAIKALARLHYRISCIRKNVIHKLTSWLTKNHSVVVIEDLNVSGMLRNHRLANAIADSSLYECRRQLEYKAKLYDTQIIIADRFYPSSQLCFNCGHRQKMPLHKRVFDCEKCKTIIDRDLNASINLASLAVSSTV
ncbi:RNA-guided endonuclease TnpB family protein [Cyanothece sp. BG0011]|uniref:RNA-guided endonuclease InsQ/TnpB family protein n=1 Tax=Cyanothece sp. BG0011 TaxID=2082950 RepID=UPI000D1EE769|nr:RNA-guided endonuclease TnpB family protein [Cyanothece sp. BG0011]